MLTTVLLFCYTGTGSDINASNDANKTPSYCHASSRTDIVALTLAVMLRPAMMS